MPIDIANHQLHTDISFQNTQTTATMIDHLFFPVPPSLFETTVAWYLAALTPLGYSKQAEIPGPTVGFGIKEGSAPFWITAKENAQATGIHLAFRTNNHETVDKFYEEAIKAGGVSDGAPGLRTRFHPDYYAAYVLDPSG
jgi:hypothetical protein